MRQGAACPSEAVVSRRVQPSSHHKRAPCPALVLSPCTFSEWDLAPNSSATPWMWGGWDY